jgi:HlyD family secretion protein
MMPLPPLDFYSYECSPVVRIAALLLIGIALGVGGMLAFRSDASGRGTADGNLGTGFGSSAPRSGLLPRRSIAALGTLQPRGGVVQISSPLVGYQIKQVLVQDGQLVKTGELLVELDAAPAKAEHELALSQQAEAAERQQTEIELAKERVAAAQLAVQQATEGRQLELDAQQSRIEVAGARKKQAEKDLKRVEELHKLPEPLAAEQQVEQQRLMLDAAGAEENAAKAAFKRLEQSLTFQEQKTTAELRAAQQSLTLAEKGTGLESLKRRVELTNLKLQQTKVTAPAAGVVLGVQAHPGEVVAQQPLLQIANLDNLVCEAEVETGDVPYLQTNQKATVSCRAFQGTVLDGTVDRVGNQVTQTALRPLDPRQPVDRDVTKVVVLIDSNKAARLINLPGKDRRVALVGLQVEVVFPLTK